VSAATDIRLEDLEAILGGIPCQGENHARGSNGHVTAQPAAWLLACPKCGPGVMQCNGRVQRLREMGQIRCYVCRGTFPFGKWGKIPL
jgi:hypothetical protein